MSVNIDFRGLFLKTRETNSHKHSFLFRPVFDRRGGFLQPVLDFVGEDTKSASDIKKFLVALPRLNFNEAVRRAFGAAKAPVKEFLASFAERFEYNKRLTQVRLKGVTRRRLRGKQQAAAIPTRSEPSAPSAQPARRVPIPFRRTRAATRRK